MSVCMSTYITCTCCVSWCFSVVRIHFSSRLSWCYFLWVNLHWKLIRRDNVHSLSNLIAFCFLSLPLKVTSSTCPLSSKTTGSSSGRNTECSSFWTLCAFTMGEFHPHSNSLVCTKSIFPTTMTPLTHLSSSSLRLPGRAATKRATWARTTSGQSGRHSTASSSTTSARACRRRRCTASWDMWPPSGMRSRSGVEY